MDPPWENRSASQKSMYALNLFNLNFQRWVVCLWKYHYAALPSYWTSACGPCGTKYSKKTSNITFSYRQWFCAANLIVLLFCLWKYQMLTLRGNSEWSFYIRAIIGAATCHQSYSESWKLWRLEIKFLIWIHINLILFQVFMSNSQLYVNAGESVNGELQPCATSLHGSSTSTESLLFVFRDCNRWRQWRNVAHFRHIGECE